MITQIGRSGMALLIYGSTAKPSYCGIGSGSGTVTVNRTGLLYEWDRNIFTGSDATTQYEAEFTTDFSSIEMSGLNLREFGIFSEASGGKLWNVEGFPAINFDGTNELQVVVRFQIF